MTDSPQLQAPGVDPEAAPVRLGAPRPMVVGTVRDGRGRPASRLRLRVLGGYHRDLVETDERGRFQVPWDRVEPLASDGAPLVVAAVVDASGQPCHGLVGSTRLPALGHPSGELDLGTIHLVQLPLLARGRVVDDLGEPVGGAWIRVEPGELAPHVESEHEQASDVAAEEMIRAWLERHVTHADSEGRFEIRGLAGEGPRVLLASHGKISAYYGRHSRTEFVAGTEELHVVLPRLWRLCGSVLVDAAALAAGIEVRVGDGLGACVTEGRFMLEGVDPGPKDLIFWTRWDGRGSIRVLRGVELRSGEESHDPRLEPVDLRGRIRAFEILVRDAHGMELGGAGISGGLEVPGPELRTDSHGRATLYSSRDSLDVWVAHPGFRAQQMLLERPSTLVVLEAGEERR